MKRQSLMVLGCTSSAGKSLLVTGLCRWFARRGVDVVPFKAQNMSNNARVVDGGEIGVAQYLQARAAGVEPTVDMNPVLLKPEAETRSQVIVHGRVRHDLSAMPWRDRGPHLWPAMAASYDRLHDAHELVILEGAGSPAEINLPDLVNNQMLAHADASALLVVDIDRGGAFAHVVGTWTLVPEETRTRLAGFVLNKFRGDAELLPPGPAAVSARTGMAHLGTMPMLQHQLPDEEGGSIRAVGPAGAPSVSVIRYPFASNLDEWHLLPHAVRMRWAAVPADLDTADVVVLPGSKHVAADRSWLRQRRFDDAIAAAVTRGARVIGVCGGAMLLGTDVQDPTGVEGSTQGLGLLPLRTVMDPEKTAVRTQVRFDSLPGPWEGLNGISAPGYEIRNGVVVDGGACEVTSLVWCRGNVLATTVHGLFEHPEIVEAAFGLSPPLVLERTFDQLADAIDEHLEPTASFGR